MSPDSPRDSANRSRRDRGHDLPSDLRAIVPRQLTHSAKISRMRQLCSNRSKMYLRRYCLPAKDTPVVVMNVESPSSPSSTMASGSSRTKSLRPQSPRSTPPFANPHSVYSTFSVVKSVRSPLRPCCPSWSATALSASPARARQHQPFRSTRPIRHDQYRALVKLHTLHDVINRLPPRPEAGRDGTGIGERSKNTNR